MARSYTQIVQTAISLLLVVVPAMAQSPTKVQSQAGFPESLDTNLPLECRVPAASLDTRAPMRRLVSALEEKRPIEVLALGPPATRASGAGWSSESYVSRLEAKLENVLAGSDVVIVQRGLPGELTSEATERIRNMVTEVEPDLVIWKIGTADALAKAELEPFATALGEVLEWLASNEIDVMLIEPPYIRAMVADEHYTRLITAIEDVARSKDVAVVLRFEATRFLSQQRAETSKNVFRLFELDHHCLPDFVARAVESSIRFSMATAPGPAPNDHR